MRDIFGARNGIRTRDPDLGKVVLYQLSYSRILFQLPQLDCYGRTKIDICFQFASVFGDFFESSGERKLTN